MRRGDRQNTSFHDKWNWGIHGKWNWGIHDKWNWGAYNKKNKALKLALAASLIFVLNSQTLLAKAQNSKNSPTLTSKKLRQSTKLILQNVPEFEFIVKEASKLGVRVFLFGGTASSFLNYAKDYTLWEKGSQDYYDVNFTRDSKGHFDYTLIYRPSQDLDIVVDGSERKIQRLENSIEARFPYVQGEKSEWELRSLRGTYGNKTPLLGDKDFRNQHTDSHSVSMVELTKPPKDKSRIRDLRHWDKDITPMEKDILKGRISFYYSKEHESTSRYQEGLNPPILSVIRYFIKAFQHSLIIPEEYLKPNSEISKIIQDFEPSEASKGYVNHWMERNVPKLFLHSVDVEYAWDILEKVGLRQKLLKVGRKNREETPAWWMNKEPLRSSLLGKEGRTARELGIKFVVHDTSVFHVYDIITRSRKGLPNVFTSRDGVSGEFAAYGDGFYTAKGTKNTIFDTGFSIRFKVNPKAREGIDFEVINDIVLILNKKAIKVIPEEIKVPSLYEYFLLLSKGRIDANEQGLLEKLKRKLQAFDSSISEKEQEKIKDLVLSKISNFIILAEWFFFPISINHPEVMEKMFARAKRSKKFLLDIAENLLPLPNLKNHPELIERVITEAKGNKEVLSVIARDVLSQPSWKDHPKLVERVITEAKGNQWVLKDIAFHVLSEPHWKRSPELVEQLIIAAKGNQQVLISIAEHILTQPHWKKHPELVKQFINEANKGDRYVLQWVPWQILSKPHWKRSPELVEQLIAVGKGLLVNIARDVLSKPHWKNHPKLVEQLINASKGSKKLLELIAMSVFSQPHWAKHPELLEKLITEAKGNKQVLVAIARYVLDKPYWKNPKILKRVIAEAKGSKIVLNSIKDTLSEEPHWKHYSKLRQKCSKLLE